MAAPTPAGPSPEEEERLIELVGRCRGNPLSFVRACFPWGSGELADYVDGPDEWQSEILAAIRDQLTPQEALRVAVASGHGIGKSALIAWIILYCLSTMTDTRGIVTANTASQLSSKTWAELSKWHRRCLTKHWFTVTATAIYSVDPERELVWRFDAIPWSAQRPQAFAGLHNKGKRAVVLFDEASTIENIIWETAEGALTDSAALDCVWKSNQRNRSVS
jgi:hypothetical protein